MAVKLYLHGDNFVKLLIELVRSSDFTESTYSKQEWKLINVEIDAMEETLKGKGDWVTQALDAFPALPDKNTPAFDYLLFVDEVEEWLNTRMGGIPKARDQEVNE